MSVEENFQTTRKYIEDMASNAHSNVKTFIQPDNLKVFAKSIPGKATTLATETVPNAFNKGVDTIRNPIKMAAAVDTFNYNHPKWFLLGAAVELVVWLWLFYYWNPYNFFSDHRQYTILFLLMWGFVQLMEIFYYRERRAAGPKPPVGPHSEAPSVTDVLSKSLATIFGVCACVAGIYSTLYVVTHVPTLATVLQWGFRLLVGCGILAFLYVLFLPVIGAAKKNPGGLLELIGSMIMYFPCLLIDLVDWVKHQYDITTSTAWIVLGITSLAIAILIILPKAITWMLNRDGVHLLRDPVYLDKEHQLSNYDQLKHIFEGDDQYGNSNRGYHYSISSWFWINPQPPNTRAAYTRWTNILEFGGRPAIEYLGTTNELRVMCDIKGDKRIEIFRSDDIPFQSWNNIVINYDGGTMDVFLNGVLVASRQAAFYQSLENVIAGADKGIEGGICNVVFYDKILLPGQIEMAYKALRRMPQPVL